MDAKYVVVTAEWHQSWQAATGAAAWGVPYKGCACQHLAAQRFI